LIPSDEQIHSRYHHDPSFSSLAEIQEAIEKLGPEERAELWTWFQEAEESDELVHQVRDWYSGVAIKMGRRQGATRKHI